MIAAVHLAHVSRTFGSGHAARVAVDDVTGELGNGSRTALVGPSGSGKTTLLHLLAGLDSPTTGTILWPGLGGDPRTDRSLVGTVFQAPSLVPALDALENVALPLVLAGVRDDDARARARSALERLDLDDLAAKLPEELSGGQAQRVALARVLAGRPRLVLADEPTGQLDHRTAAHVLDVLLDTVAELGASLVVSTHDPVVAARCTARWELSDGRLLTTTSAGVHA